MPIAIYDHSVNNRVCFRGQVSSLPSGHLSPQAKPQGAFDLPASISHQIREAIAAWKMQSQPGVVTDTKTRAATQHILLDTLLGKETFIGQRLFSVMTFFRNPFDSPLPHFARLLLPPKIRHSGDPQYTALKDAVLEMLFSDLRYQKQRKQYNNVTYPWASAREGWHAVQMLLALTPDRQKKKVRAIADFYPLQFLRGERTLRFPKLKATLEYVLSDLYTSLRRKDSEHEREAMAVLTVLMPQVFENPLLQSEGTWKQDYQTRTGSIWQGPLPSKSQSFSLYDILPFGPMWEPIILTPLDLARDEDVFTRQVLPKMADLAKSGNSVAKKFLATDA
ncbi:MAG: hypothetical protein K2X01_05055 [Cyanobacteria bacterium]|nr:hypothetical protein [Cyanobacteriota bacterium]